MLYNQPEQPAQSHSLNKSKIINVYNLQPFFKESFFLKVYSLRETTHSKMFLIQPVTVNYVCTPGRFLQLGKLHRIYPKQPCQHAISGHHQPASETPFKSRFTGGTK